MITPEVFKVYTRQNSIKQNQVTALHLMIGFLLFMMGMVTWLVPSFLKTEKFAFLDGIGIGYSVFGLFLIIVSIFFNKKIIRKPTGNYTLRIIEILALLPVVIYTIAHQWFLPFGYSFAALLVIILAYVWERKSQGNRIIGFSRKSIHIPLFFRNRIIPWRDVESVVLRHSVLTVNCHNNRFFQFDALIPQPKIGSIEEFHLFCLDQIKKHENDPKDDW